MKTLLDIGIDIEGIMNVFIPRQSEIPFEESNRIKLSNLENSELLLHIYEGVCIENKRNHLMKTIQLENVRDGFFLVQMSSWNYISGRVLNRICGFVFYSLA